MKTATHQKMTTVSSLSLPKGCKPKVGLTHHVWNFKIIPPISLLINNKCCKTKLKAKDLNQETLSSHLKGQNPPPPF